jgi:hypothetical protein
MSTQAVETGADDLAVGGEPSIDAGEYERIMRRIHGDDATVPVSAFNSSI